ncbi:hypothetical protein [Gimesia aquarii]|uniref:hypothetical protein n=1 Tax=Gimesia aquarii TaxID=2527964 RepID=UPI001E59CCD7|nr:hypothetical protein [Gimesia aquarii]
MDQYQEVRLALAVVQLHQADLRQGGVVLQAVILPAQEVDLAPPADQIRRVVRRREKILMLI